ncbi:MAG: VWA domain-containing protein [Candidatus Paceibacterota bacterium]|jgi:hypothetical protein
MIKIIAEKESDNITIGLTFTTKIVSSINKKIIDRFRLIKTAFQILVAKPESISFQEREEYLQISFNKNKRKRKSFKSFRLFRKIEKKALTTSAITTVLALVLQTIAPIIFLNPGIALADNMCSVAVDVVVIMDVSGSMETGESPSKCEWSEIKPDGGGYTWYLNTKYNVTEDWCNNVRNSFDEDEPVYQNIPLKYTPATNAKITDAKTAAKNFLDNFKTEDQSALVSFSSSATLVKTLSNDHVATKTAVDGLTTGGLTNIGGAIEKGKLELDSARSNPKANKVIVLLTDGKANRPYGTSDGENSADVQYAKDKALEAAAAGYKVFTVGLGSDGDINQTMLQEIAASTGATYYHSPNGNGLSQIYQDIAYEICQYSSISGCKYQDSNADGVLEGESKLSGWEIVLSGDASSTQLTDADGCYTFAGLLEGNYTVSEGANLSKQPFLQTYPLGNSHSIALGEAEDRIDIHFANVDNSLCQLTDTPGDCTSDGFRHHAYTYNYSFCGQDSENDVADQTCSCQLTDTPAECVSDGMRNHDYTYNYLFCGQDYTSPVTDQSCDCSVYEDSRTCIDDGMAQVNYKYNYSFCGQDYSQEEQDMSCSSDYQCQDWQDGDCVGDGTIHQTRICTDQYTNSYTEQRDTADASCSCTASEASRACVSEGTANVTYDWNYPYCGQSYVTSEPDSNCDCVYSSWQDGECSSEGYRHQTRTKETIFCYCNDLERENEDSSCDCLASELSRQCIENNLANVTYHYNYPYCGQDYTQEESDPLCQGYGCLASESSRICTSDGYATVTYTWNNPSCGSPYDQQVLDSSCNCVETEVPGQCTDSNHRNYTFTYNYQYCTQKPAEDREDASCSTAPPIVIGPGDIVINEIMHNPLRFPANNRWFEILNTTGTDLDLSGCTIEDLDTSFPNYHVITSLTLPANGYRVLGGNNNLSMNGGANVDYVYSNFLLENTSDEIVLTCNSTEIDRVIYDSTFPNTQGSSIVLANPSLDNSIGANWCDSVTSYGAGDKGTPGTLNDPCSGNACTASESSRICTSDGYATVTYVWDEQPCGDSYDQQVADISCTCIETEVPGQCTDSMHRNYTFTYNYEYCAQKPAEDREDSSCSIPPQCSDGIDNDLDGFIDYPNDPQCASPEDETENEIVMPFSTIGGGTGSLSWQLTVDKSGTGTGAITGSGIDCGDDCTESYGDNAEVTLTANPLSDSNFNGWTGDCSGTESTCQITMNSNKNVGAEFSSTGEVAGEATSTEENGEVLGETTTCGLYLFEYIKTGANNNPEEVKKLQTFLNENMGSNLPITGFYGQQTRKILEQFQLKYKIEVLEPWVKAGLWPSIDIPTGYVYKTTKRWINLIKCPTLDIPMPSFEEDYYSTSQESPSISGEVLGEGTTTATTTEEISTTTEEISTTTGDETLGTTTESGDLTNRWITIGVLGGVALIIAGYYFFVSKKKKPDQQIG